VVCRHFHAAFSYSVEFWQITSAAMLLRVDDGNVRRQRLLGVPSKPLVSDRNERGMVHAGEYAVVKAR
jgi:hypothetical protein